MKPMSEEKAIPKEQQTGATGARVPRVLVVDDVPINVKILEVLLIPLKYSVAKAFGGLEALDVIEREDIDLVLLDVMMPDIDGIEVCRRIKSREETRYIPVVMVTALDEIEPRIKAIEAGADDFLGKPVNKLELTTRTRSLIAVKRLHEKRIALEKAQILLANALEVGDGYKRALQKIRLEVAKSTLDGQVMDSLIIAELCDSALDRESCYL